jgi:hypothetical protein
MKKQNTNKVGWKYNKIMAVVGIRGLYFCFLLYTSVFDKFSIVNMQFL